MRIKRVEIENFRLLRSVTVGFEAGTTLIVGRNNSGKTSIAELFRRMLSEKAIGFRLEDFSLGSHEDFWRSGQAFSDSQPVQECLAHLPMIKVALDITYDVASPDLGPIGDCIIDLNPECTHARLVLMYAPRPTAITALFANLITPDGIGDIERAVFFREIANRLPLAYTATLEAVDPNDSENRKSLDLKLLSTIVRGGFINAQRGLDDDTFREKDVLGKVVEVLFQSALTDPVDAGKRSTAEQLKIAVEQIQGDLHTGFNANLTSLLPTFDLFGYPGLADPGLVTETSFDVEKLLSNHTKVRYTGVNGTTLPETYNGLGVRNLVYMLLQLLRFFREYQATPTATGVHLVFIEEPEAHLHPQMQEVFIRQLDHIAQTFISELNEGRPWPVQFVVTTHSPHMANEARFESMRYFLSRTNEQGLRSSAIKDLRDGMGDAPEVDRNFLHQYLTLTRCDLFFADKAILIEGTAERLLLPTMIIKTDAAAEGEAKLASQYLTTMEVGGAYAHRFFDLLSFLELRTLVITDIDSVSPNDSGKRVSVPVADGQFTSNGCIKAWFAEDVSPADLVAKTPDQKTVGIRRIAFQIPEEDAGPCGRSFEDAFILANPQKFILGPGDQAALAYALAAEQKKSTFALDHAIVDTEWNVPRYIREGLRWLAQGPNAPAVVPAEVAAEIIEGVAQAAASEGAGGANG
jgi:hypothetical protein